ncbi:MAG: hypothetical protein WA826_11650, partial [Silvibacterium sp.]
AASCSASDVQTAINSASDGDTVLVPNATCSSGTPATWTSGITVSKGIYLNGQGSYVAFGSGGSLTINEDAVHGALVENFNFKNGFTNGGCPVTFNIAASDQPSRYTSITHSDTTNSGPVTLLCINGLGTMLVDHNTFTTTNGADEVIHILGLGSGGDNWTDDLIPGSPHMIYIETNTFQNNAGALSSAEEAYYGAEFVFRYDTLYLEQNDIHGGDGGRWGEIYQNTYHINGSFAPSNLMQFRGGSGLYYDNHSSGTVCCSDPNPSVSIGPDCPSSDICSGSWPVAKQIGRGMNATTYSPLYAWGNDSAIQANIGASGGQSLVLVGTATTDSTHCSGHPGNVCDAVVTSSMPTLQRCESAADVAAGCPVSFSYTAFTYPYPLTADGLPNPGGTTSGGPSAPVNLQGTMQ